MKENPTVSLRLKRADKARLKLLARHLHLNQTETIRLLISEKLMALIEGADADESDLETALPLEGEAFLFEPWTPSDQNLVKPGDFNPVNFEELGLKPWPPKDSE